MEKNNNISNHEERPLITFALFAYNQEQFIDEAVQGALSQTYSPLEIILSDDCSADRTFEIMKEMTAAYRGPHQIVLNRTESNLGIGGHINRIMEIARGELIVAAAGDDISVSERCEEIFYAWLHSGKKAYSIYSSISVIDANSKSHGVLRNPPGERAKDPFFMAKKNCPYVTGASHAWHRDVFDLFGPMVEGTVCEDRVLTFRSVLLGGIAYIEKPLVRYRRHKDNISRVPEKVRYRLLNYHRCKEISAQYSVNYARNYLKDVSVFCHDNKELIRFIQGRLHFCELQHILLSRPFGERLRALVRARYQGVELSAIMDLAIKYLMPIPYNAYCLMQSWGKKKKHLWDRILSREVVDG